MIFVIFRAAGLARTRTRARVGSLRLLRFDPLPTRARTRTRVTRMRVTSGRKSLYLDYGNRPPE